VGGGGGGVITSSATVAGIPKATGAAGTGAGRMDAGPADRRPAGRGGERVSPAAAQGALFGAGLAAVGAIAAVALNRWGFDKDSRRFFAALTLGILGRLLLYGAALVYVALRTRIDVTATAASLLGFYVLFQIVEIRLALRGLKTKS